MPRFASILRTLTALDSPRIWIAVAIAAVLASIPAMGVGLVHDDIIQRAALDGAFPDFERNAFQLYDFLDAEDSAAIPKMREHGYVPWWTSEALHIRFFRPLSSATMALDHVLFGKAALPAHLHGLIYFVLASLLVLAILRMTLPPRAAGAGALLYAIAGCHAMPVMWVAARHILVAAVLGLAAVAAHIAYREKGWRLGALLAPLALIGSLLASESALAAVALIGCYELLAGRGSMARRALALLPTAVLSLGYLAFYTAAGYGERGSGAYIHPLHEPAEFAAAAVVRVPALVAEALSSMPSMVGATIPPLMAIFAGLGALLAAVVLALVWAMRARLSPETGRHLAWMAAGGVLGLLPVAGGIIGGRLLAIPMLGAAGILGWVLTQVFAHARGAQGGRRLAFRLAGMALLIMNVGLALFMRAAMPDLFGRIGTETRRIALNSDLGCRPGGDVVLVAAADPSVGYYGPATRLYERVSPAWRSFWLLSVAPQAHRVEVVDDRRLVVSTVGERQINWWEWAHRDQPVAKGHRTAVRDMQIEVLETSPLGPTRFEVAFARPLSAPDLCFVVWRDGLLRPLALPAPGKSVLVPHQPGPMMQ